MGNFTKLQEEQRAAKEKAKLNRETHIGYNIIKS